MPVDPLYLSKNYAKSGVDVSAWVVGGTLEFATTAVSNPILQVSGANVLCLNFPTDDPHVAGALWSNSGVLTISQG